MFCSFMTCSTCLEIHLNSVHIHEIESVCVCVRERESEREREGGGGGGKKLLEGELVLDGQG